MPLSPAPSRSSRSSVIKTTEIGFAGVEGALRHFGGVTEEVLLAEQMTIRLTRDHGFADSPLEEAGFEPSVPRKAPASPRCRLSFAPYFGWRGAGGTDGSNPAPSSSESGPNRSLLGLETPVERRQRCG
jgi:hypothetical protein